MRRVSRGMACGCALLLVVAAPLWAGPIEFGTSELQRALAARGLSPGAVQIRTAPSGGGAECFTIVRSVVSGSDARGLMYGLLDAAEQIRAVGRLSDSSGCPATAMRGVRTFLHNEALEKNWYYSRDYWERYFELLARDRFNRFNLVFAHQTNYLAPPYPFWIELPSFTQIRVPGLSPAARNRNLEMLQYISQAAADHGIDFTLGIWEQSVGVAPLAPRASAVEGLTRDNIGPYSHAALAMILQLCPAIRSVQIRTNEESGIPDDLRLRFYRDYIYTAVRDAGHPVSLDLRAWALASDMVDASDQAGLRLRVSTKYWAEYMGRPYQPAETFAGYSYLDFLKKPRSYSFFWELWGLGSHRLLLWGDPDFVRRTVSTFRLGNGIGFEIDPPLAQKGFGNRPGEWALFTPANKDRVFWKWEFERYWLFYALWGRLSYSPATADSVWLAELERRFGSAAPDVLAAYRGASGVINELVAVHLADPNMYIWPEVNPGGLLNSYRDALPSDPRFIASIPEAVENRIRHVASAKQTPQQTAARLLALARRTEEAIARVDVKLPLANAEWRSSKADFAVLARLARYHALKGTAVDQVAYFDATGDRAALNIASRDITAALRVWEQLAAATTGVYSEQMVFGPDDVGHWKDKLPYVRHDVELVRERAAIADRFGRFEQGFDFGEIPKRPSRATVWRDNDSVVGNTVEPRFKAVDAGTKYDDVAGYGWLSDGDRKVEAMPLTPYLEMHGVAKNPTNLPRDVLYRDFIKGQGAQVFRVKAVPGQYTVHFLHPDHSDTSAELMTRDQFLDIRFPSGEWMVSGLVIKGRASRTPLESQVFPGAVPRPSIVHAPPSSASPRREVSLRIRIAPVADITRIRLHYRAVNQNVPFKTIEKPGGLEQTFTIPAADVPANWDLMYYFEILNGRGGGWFQPDPARVTPYYVIEVRAH